MSRLALLLLVPALAAAAPPPDEEVDALALLAGARELDDNGMPSNISTGLNDGLANESGQWEPQKMGPTHSIVLQLAEPFDLHRMVVVNSFSERQYPGISTKKMKLEHGTSRTGPWKPLTEVSLKKGTKPQKFDLPPTKAVRYLKLTLLENYGEESWWSLAELSVFGRRSKPRAKVDFNGIWETPYGPMRLTQTGSLITGCYGDGSNLVEGTVDGPIFFGTYVESESTGALAFALTSEGELAGVYGNDLNANRSTRWDGTVLQDTGMKCAPQPKKDEIEQTLKETGRVVLRGILFDTGKDLIKTESIPTLEKLAKAIKSGGGSYVIEGHTDDRGGEAMNKTLSEKRAASVKKWLVENGVKAEVLSTVGHGQSKPTMPNDSEAGRAANRRVEVAK